MAEYVPTSNPIPPGRSERVVEMVRCFIGRNAFTVVFATISIPHASYTVFGREGVNGQCGITEPFRKHVP